MNCEPANLDKSGKEYFRTHPKGIRKEHGMATLSLVDAVHNNSKTPKTSIPDPPSKDRRRKKSNAEKDEPPKKVKIVDNVSNVRMDSELHHPDHINPVYIDRVC
jgi:hypothetical protein